MHRFNIVNIVAFFVLLITTPLLVGHIQKTVAWQTGPLTKTMEYVIDNLCI